MGSAVLTLAAGAASASSAHPGSLAPSSAAAEAVRLQQTWGAHVVVDATVVDGSALLVSTRDRALLHADSPARWLHTSMSVTLLNVTDLGPNAGLSEPACGSEGPMGTVEPRA